MKALVVDDEPRACHILELLLQKRQDIERVDIFHEAASALDFVKKNHVDVAFLDIEMPEENGIHLAMNFLELPQSPAVIFVTGYAHYALAAWDTDAVDFILKPFGVGDIDRALGRAAKLRSLATGKRIFIQCFPTFALQIDGITVVMRHKKSKELLAYLVHHCGAWVDMNDAVAALFEDKTDEGAKNYYRLVLYRLKKTLKEYGAENMLETQYSCCRIDPNAFDCDYYRYRNGETHLFHGEYLTEYSWAEFTVGTLLR